MSLAARTTLFLAQYGVIFVVLLLVTGLGSLAMAGQAYTDDRTEIVTEDVDVEEYAVNTQTEAVVDSAVNPELYEPGERLVDMPVYFYNESPELSLLVEIETPNDVEVDVDARLTVEIVAQRDGEVFWEEVELLAFEEATVSDGQVTFEGSKDMREVVAVVDRIDSRIGGAGNVESQFVLEVMYESEEYEGSLTTDSEIVLTQGAYWLDGDFEETQTESRTQTIEEPLGPDRGQVSLYGLMAIMSLLVAGVVAVVLRGDIDTEQLETDVAHSQHEDWISHGEIPTRGEKEFVGIDSLVDLVDIAIDSNKRVIYQRSIDTYAVIEGDLVYFYSPSREQIEDWLGV